MSDIILSPGARDSIRSLSEFDKLLARTQERLTTSKRVNSVLDDASAFFASRDLGNVAKDYDEYIGNTQRAIDLVQVTADALEGITQLLEQQLSLVRSAQSTPSVRAGTYNALLQVFDQISLLVTDAEYRGQALLGSAQESFTYRVGAATDAILTLQGRAAKSQTAADGAIYTGDSDNSGFSSAIANSRVALALSTTVLDFTVSTTTSAQYDNIIAGLQSAISRTRGGAQSYATAVTVLQIRAEFNTKYQTTSNKASERLVSADLNEEGANLVTLQTRRELGLEALAAEGRNVRAILTLLR
jgi:flagellin-like hook-associated protein FlgL